MVLFEATFYNITTEENEKRPIIFDVEIVDEGEPDFEKLCWTQAVIMATDIVKENKHLSLDTLEFISC